MFTYDQRRWLIERRYQRYRLDVLVCLSQYYVLDDCSARAIEDVEMMVDVCFKVHDNPVRAAYVIAAEMGWVK